MPRPRREDFSGAFHHVMNRGARRQSIFKLPGDCQKFLDLIEDVVDRFGIEVHAYSLMPNHYHLLVRSVRGNLSESMQSLNGSYTGRFNWKHKSDGPLFRGRFKSQLVTSESYLRFLPAYLHLNPLRARLVPRLTSEAWTSHRAYLGLERTPKWLTTRFFLDLLGGDRAFDAFVRSIHQGATRYPEELDLETGLFQRGAATRAEEAGTVKARRRARLDGPSGPRPADEVIAEVCRVAQTTEASLLKKEHGPGANPARRLAIWALYRSGMKQREIARTMRSSYFQVSKLLSQLRRVPAREPLRGWMKEWTSSR